MHTPTPMALRSLLSSSILLLALSLSSSGRVFFSEASPIDTTDMYSLCSEKIPRCNATLYYNSNGLTIEQIAPYYSVDLSQISTFSHQNEQDYLIRVPCSCQSVNGTLGFFYSTSYQVQQGDTFFKVSSQIYNMQAYEVGNEASTFRPGVTVPIYLMCGCVKNEHQVVVTYTVQQSDTLLSIGNMLSALVSGIKSLSRVLKSGEGQFSLPGWVLFVPTELKGNLGS